MNPMHGTMSRVGFER